MAATRLMPPAACKGRTVEQEIRGIIDYTENPQKTDGVRLITSRQCDSRIADAVFPFTKNQYIQKAGRVRGEDDVIAYHLRQSFVPGEITPEEANERRQKGQPTSQKSGRNESLPGFRLEAFAMICAAQCAHAGKKETDTGTPGVRFLRCAKAYSA